MSVKLKLWLLCRHREKQPKVHFVHHQPEQEPDISRTLSDCLTAHHFSLKCVHLGRKVSDKCKVSLKKRDRKVPGAGYKFKQEIVQTEKMPQNKFLIL